MFNSALLYEVAVLKVYAEPLLFQIPRDSAEYLEAKRLLKFWTIFCRFRRKELHRVLWCGNLSEEVVLMYKNTVNFTA